MYKLGEVEADTRRDLGKEAVNYCGLGLPDDENIRRRVRYKNPTCEIEKRNPYYCRKTKGMGI